MLVSLGQSLELADVSITTPQIHIVPLRAHHARAIAQEFNQTITQFMVPAPIKSVSQAIHFINLANDLKIGCKGLVMAVVHPISSEFLGVVALIGHQNLVAPEIGVWIKQSAHGHYYGRYAVHAICAWAVKHVRVKYFVYPVSKLNVPSQKVALSLGGTVVNEKMTRKESGELMDEWVYHINANEIGTFLLVTV